MRNNFKLLCFPVASLVSSYRLNEYYFKDVTVRRTPTRAMHL